MLANGCFVILTMIEILFYLFHFSLLILLISLRNSTFKGPFYSIFKIVIFGDSINFVCLCIFEKFSLIPSLHEFYTTNYYFGSIVSTIYSYIVVVIFSGHFLMAFNRFTLLWFPLQYKKIWKYQWYTVALLLLPMINISWRMTEPVTFRFVSNEDTVLKFGNPSVGERFFLFQTLIFLTTTCFAAIFNVLSVIKFYLMKSIVMNVNEKNLLAVSLITFVAQLLRTSYAAQQFFLPNREYLTNIFATALPLLNDIYALSGSISFIILSSSLRKQWQRLYLCPTQYQSSVIKIVLLPINGV